MSKQKTTNKKDVKAVSKDTTIDDTKLFNRVSIEARRDEKASDDDKSVYKDVVMMTDETNSNGWKVEVKGVNIPKANRQGIQIPVYFEHNSRDIAIGGAYNIQKTKDKIGGVEMSVIKGDFEIDRSTEKGVQVDNSIIKGYTKGVSVGMHIVEDTLEEAQDSDGNPSGYSWTINKADLYEVSATADPAYDKALIKARTERHETSKYTPQEPPQEEEEDDNPDREVPEPVPAMARKITDEDKKAIARSIAKTVYKSALRELNK